VISTAAWGINSIVPPDAELSDQERPSNISS
jgi:hypothetical protein